MQGFMQSTRSVTEHTWEGLNMHVMCQGSGGARVFPGEMSVSEHVGPECTRGVCVCVCVRARVCGV